MNEAITELLRRELTNRMTIYGIQNPEQAVTLSIQIFNETFEPPKLTLKGEQSLTFAERQRNRAIEFRDRIIKQTGASDEPRRR